MYTPSRHSRGAMLIAVASLLAACAGDVKTGPSNGVGSLSLTTQPSPTVQTRVQLPVQPTVQLLDGGGAPLAQAGVTIAAAVASGGGTLTGATAAVTNANGVASFTNLAIQGSAGFKALSFSTPGVTPLSSGTITVTAGPAAVISPVSNTTQSSQVSQAVASRPSVKVSDLDNNGIPGVTVTFALGTGASTLSGTTPVTDAAGVAMLGSWTLGAAQGSYTVTASVNGLGGSPLTFTANTTTSQFSISLIYVIPPTPARQAAFDAAAARWTQVILNDLPDIAGPVNVLPNCTAPRPAPTLPSIDDVVIQVDLDSIDGPGKILGQAGPCMVRQGGLTAFGTMTFDSADVAGMQQNGTLNAVILHEMAHVLGFGTLWPTKGLIVGAGQVCPTFIGASAIAQYQVVGGPGSTPVPVEGNAQPLGTRDAHWSEAAFNSELMTGFIDATDPLSVVTVGSMQDLGYTVNFGAADSYVLGAVRASSATPRVRLQEGAPPPIYIIDRSGKIISRQ